MASEKPTSKGQAWFCTTGLPSDVIIEVEEMAFHLHKFPLMSRSGKLNRMITEQEISTHREGQEEEEEEEEECYLLNLPGFPGGSEAFEIAAKFCYGVKLELTPSNAAPLRCAAEYLEMTEEHGDGNLIARTEAFLNQSVLRSVKDAVKTLSSCERLLPEAEDLGIVQRCIDAIAIKAGADQLASGDQTSPNGSILWNGIFTGLRHRDQVRPDWWCEELTVLGLPFYKRVVSAMEARDLNPESIEGSLVCYAKKFIPGLSRRNRVSSSHSASVATEDEQRELLETVVSHMPVRKSSSPTTTARLLFGLLRTANILSASDSCRTMLERKIAAQLDQATLDELLLPSYSYLIETLYDIDCVERILEYFLEGCGDADAEEEGEEEEEEEEGPRRYGNSSGLNPVMAVGKLMDGYLAEIASDGNLKPEKFYNLAVALPDHARAYDDGLYRAIDVYLKAHPWVSDEEREKICSLIDCQKLTLEACTHAAQNERLPLRVVVQVLFFEQLQLRNAIAGSVVAPDASLPDSGHPVRLQDHIAFSGESPAAQPWQTTFRNNQVLRFDMDSMRARVHELERECSTMRRAIRKFDKAKKGGGVGGGSSGGDGGGDAEVGGNGGWVSFTKKFGCKFKTQVCDSHERTWVEAKKGSHHHHHHNRNSSLT